LGWVGTICNLLGVIVCLGMLYLFLTLSFLHYTYLKTEMEYQGILLFVNLIMAAVNTVSKTYVASGEMNCDDGVRGAQNEWQAYGTWLLLKSGWFLSLMEGAGITAVGHDEDPSAIRQYSCFFLLRLTPTTAM
jgi:hypothetical protein